MIMLVKVIFLSLLGLLIAMFSLYKMTKKRVTDKVQEVKFLGVEFKGDIWLATLIIGVIIVFVGVGFFGSGTNDPVNKLGSNSYFQVPFISNAYAESPPNKECKRGNTGWVWIGKGSYNNSRDWAATLVEGSFPDANGKIHNKLILKTIIWRNLREYHFSNITGTWMGALLGVKLPELTCILKKNSKIEVNKVTSVGLSKIWAKIIVL